MNWGILALFHIQRWHTDYAPVPSLSHSVFTNGVRATRRNISLKTLPRLRQKVQIGRVHNLFAAIGHRSKRERASSSASPEIIPSMIVHCINNNTCTVGIYLILGVSDKMLDLAAIKRDWTAKSYRCEDLGSTNFIQPRALRCACIVVWSKYEGWTNQPSAISRDVKIQSSIFLAVIAVILFPTFCSSPFRVQRVQWR